MRRSGFLFDERLFIQVRKRLYLFVKIGAHTSPREPDGIARFQLLPIFQRQLKERAALFTGRRRRFTNAFKVTDSQTVIHPAYTLWSNNLDLNSRLVPKSFPFVNSPDASELVRTRLRPRRRETESSENYYCGDYLHL